MTPTATKPGSFTTQLCEHINYTQNDAYRQIIFKDEQRQAVLVCLKAGTRLEPHAACHDGFITVIEGQGVFTLDHQEILLEPGVFISLPAKMLHAIDAIANLAFLKVVDRHDSCHGHS